jgi:drug/metabolite transporter (DMT)-like permease
VLVKKGSTVVNTALHRKGLAITATGVMILTVDTPLLRLIDGNQWTVMFWRGLMMFTAILFWWVVWGRKQSGNIQFFNGREGMVVTAGYTLSNVCFMVSVHNTTVANVLFIVALAPLVAAIMSIFILREIPKTSTWLAILFSFGGIGFIFKDSFASGHFFGDAIAFGAAVGLASAFVFTRKYDRNMVTAPGIAGAFTALIAAFFITDYSFEPMQWAYLSLNGFIILPISFGLIALGPRYITSAEVAMLMMLETIFGPYLVWLAVAEVPSSNSLIGGTVVVLTLIAHSVWRLKRS